MRTFVCYLPALVALFLLFFRSTEKVFLNVYLPVLILLPMKFLAATSGFPRLTFVETTVIPIFIAFVWREMLRWKFSLTDILVLNFILWKFLAEMVNTDLHYANNKLASMLCDNLAPYILAKGLIHRKNLDIAVAKRVVFLFFIDALISMIEVFTSANPHIDIISFLFFPGNYSIPSTRFGLTRLEGPFGAAILYGIGFALAILLNYWINKNHFWKRNFKNLPPLIVSKSTLITIVLALALVFTFSRGPLYSCLLGLLFVGIGFSKHPFATFIKSLLLASIFVALLFIIYSSYENLISEYSFGTTEYNVAYRWDLLKVYTELAWQKPIFGWGSLYPPIVRGYPSMDNAYLLFFLTYGLISLLTILFLLAWMLTRLCRFGFRFIKKNNLDSSLAFTLMSILGMMAFCLMTVFMGLQIEILFFMIIGWAEGLILFKPQQKEVHHVSAST